MGSENHVVVDISSDEEEDTGVDRDYLKWLNKDKSDRNDVVFEVKGGVDSQLNSLEDEEEEDDCVILDCDPDKTSAAVEAEADDDDDEVLVMGQKGEIACRDFPHPRHSCAKFSFNSTSHESYCHMCHCYVCDIPAPCPYWCVAVSSIAHCHANDKDKTWKNQREYFRTGNIPSQTAHPTVSPARSIIRLSQNPSPRNKIEIRPCTSSSRLTNLSNVRAMNRVRQLTPPHSHGLRSLSSVGIQKDRSTYLGNLRSRVASSGTRSNGNKIKVGLYTNAKVSQSNPSVVAPTINREMYTQQQRNCQLNVTDYSAALSTSVGGNCQFQASEDLFHLPELGSQAVTVQQQPGTNENVLQTKLSEFESWLMDSSNQAGLVAQDNVTFDFETFLND